MRSPVTHCDDSTAGLHHEGRASFRVGDAFYRPTTRVVRDLGVLAAAVYRDRVGHLRVLDAMAGCGVRSLRYWLESHADFVRANDGNPDMKALLAENLQAAIAAGRAGITVENAHRLFLNCYSQQDFYDLVDIDSFGTPAQYLGTALWATCLGGLLYLTSTDGRAGTGNLPRRALQAYGVYTRLHPAAHEQALRVLIGAAQRQAAGLDRGIEPVFAYFTGSTYRVLVRYVSPRVLTPQNYGFLGYCRRCGNYTRVAWHRLGRSRCACDGGDLTHSGPQWLGALHNPEWLQAMQQQAIAWGWADRATLLAAMIAEADCPPWFFPLGEIGKRGRIDLPKRDRLLAALRDRGYRAATACVDTQAIKTDADMQVCVEVARSLLDRE
ncbi:N2,N2-dimethylguanosine tRNA methyltransferase [Rubidibacter lacunae KORDI 51-2]|uniref:N2,N2-dimethylguanosine tRNA methyltransferase n=2 Tax=Rubidibacter TaxID=582491 RepID=U5DQV8_9CHRO|nr:N2,N2-dimethylguanosine tRNA methyltransferase [Rubidibacter lacunae KORDI 51-2]